LFILRLNKYSKIANSLIGFQSNRIVTNYSNLSEVLNICTAQITWHITVLYRSNGLCWYVERWMQQPWQEDSSVSRRPSS